VASKTTKPVEKQGRKTTGLDKTTGLPLTMVIRFLFLLLRERLGGLRRENTLIMRSRAISRSPIMRRSERKISNSVNTGQADISGNNDRTNSNPENSGWC